MSVKEWCEMCKSYHVGGGSHLNQSEAELEINMSTQEPNSPVTVNPTEDAFYAKAEAAIGQPDNKQRNSPTPRTNGKCQEIAKSGVDWHHSGQLMANFSRKLEIELNEAKDMASFYKAELEHVKEERDEALYVNKNAGAAIVDLARECREYREERDAWKAVALTPKVNL